jgi:hypothetical protein
MKGSNASQLGNLESEVGIAPGSFLIHAGLYRRDNVYIVVHDGRRMRPTY